MGFIQPESGHRHSAFHLSCVMAWVRWITLRLGFGIFSRERCVFASAFYTALGFADTRAAQLHSRSLFARFGTGTFLLSFIVRLGSIYGRMGSGMDGTG